MQSHGARTRGNWVEVSCEREALRDPRIRWNQLLRTGESRCCSPWVFACFLCQVNQLARGNFFTFVSLPFALHKMPLAVIFEPSPLPVEALGGECCV